MKAQIEKYKVLGKVYAWSYKDNKRNYPGWNFTVDINASKSLCELLDMMNNCEWSTQKNINLEFPTKSQISVPSNQRGLARWKTKPRLVLKSRKTESENHWLVIEADNRVEIQFGIDKLLEFQDAIKGIPKGEGDFPICDNIDENILYIWWNLEK